MGYTIDVPAVDADGNDCAGVLAPMVRAPLGTYTGWSLRARPSAAGAMRQMYGSYIPLPETRDEREATGDLRRSILGRYGSKGGNTRAIEFAAGRWSPKASCWKKISSAPSPRHAIGADRCTMSG